MTVSTVSNNSILNGGDGGGMHLRGEVQVSISDSAILSNTTQSASDRGGGAYISTSSSVSIGSSQFSQNASPGNGGGLNLSGSSPAEILDSSFDGNTSDSYGGAIYAGKTTHISNSTISNNSAYYGGGVYRASALSIDHSTIYENTATYSHGGIYFGGSDTEIGGTLTNSIVAGNSINGTTPSDVYGTILANYNLIESGAGVTVDGPGNILGVDPLLGLLTDNGGPTLTHELLAGSPAIDAGDPGAVAGVGDVPLYDQRGASYSRVFGGRIDMGAFEVAAPSADFNQDNDVDGGDFLTWQRGYGPAGIAAVAVGDASIADGDADGNGVVDGLDLAIWQNSFGAVVSPPAVAADTVASLDADKQVAPSVYDAALALLMQNGTGLHHPVAHEVPQPTAISLEEESNTATDDTPLLPTYGEDESTSSNPLILANEVEEIGNSVSDEVFTMLETVF